MEIQCLVVRQRGRGGPFTSLVNKKEEGETSVLPLFAIAASLLQNGFDDEDLQSQHLEC